MIRENDQVDDVGIVIIVVGIIISVVIVVIIVVVVVVIVVIVVVIIGVFLDVVVDFVGFSSLSRRLKLRQTSSLISFVTLNSDAFDRDCSSLNS